MATISDSVLESPMATVESIAVTTFAENVQDLPIFSNKY
jgi:hypothetical protein